MSGGVSGKVSGKVSGGVSGGVARRAAAAAALLCLLCALPAAPAGCGRAAAAATAGAGAGQGGVARSGRFLLLRVMASEVVGLPVAGQVTAATTGQRAPVRGHLPKLLEGRRRAPVAGFDAGRRELVIAGRPDRLGRVWSGLVLCESDAQGVPLDSLAVPVRRFPCLVRLFRRAPIGRGRLARALLAVRCGVPASDGGIDITWGGVTVHLGAGEAWAAAVVAARDRVEVVRPGPSWEARLRAAYAAGAAVLRLDVRNLGFWDRACVRGTAPGGDAAPDGGGRP